jgi:hypothetical protein
MANTYQHTYLTPEILAFALTRAKSLPVFKGSHRKLQANIVGSIGEVVFEQFLERNLVPFEDCRDSTKHDYLVGAQRLTLDLKTKDRTVKPRIDYDNSVPLYNHEHQRPRYYFFVSLLRSPGADEEDIQRFTSAFLLGGIDIKTLDRDGTKWEAGQTDPSNGTTFWTACINVSMRQLFSCSQLLRTLRGEDEQ